MEKKMEKNNLDTLTLELDSVLPLFKLKIYLGESIYQVICRICHDYQMNQNDANILFGCNKNPDILLIRYKDSQLQSLWLKANYSSFLGIKIFKGVDVEYTRENAQDPEGEYINQAAYFPGKEVSKSVYQFITSFHKDVEQWDRQILQETVENER